MNPETPPVPDPVPDQPVPLVVDLDGTLIKTDLLWESIARRLVKNPFAIFQILFWWSRGRAFMKKNLARRIKIDPATLPYHETFLAWLREQKKSGRKIILATASDLQMAEPVAEYAGVFDEVLGSDGRTNLRSENKLRALTEKFGERGFDYAGNSSADFAVWRGAREAIVVNASRTVLKQAAECTKLGPTFCEEYSPFEIARRVLNDLFWRSGYLVAMGAGLLLASAFPNPGLAGFAWITPALMLAAAHGKHGADAARVGYVAGLSFWLASLYWLLLIPVTGFPILGWISLGAYLALFSAAWVWLLAGKIGEGSWAVRTRWSLTGAAVWVGLEMIRERLFGGFPWSLLGVSQFKLIPLIQIASAMGVYGVSFLITWFSLSLFSAARMIFRFPARRHVWQAEIAFPLLVIVLLFVGGMGRIIRQNPPAETLHVTLIQPSVPQTMIWDPGANAARFQQLLALSETALTNQTDLLIWPEAALPDFDDATYAAVTNLIRTHHVWMILNADDAEYRPDATNYFNAAFLFDPDGKFMNVYHKQKLVIFGEYIPLARWLPFLKYFTPITGGWTGGDKPVTFELERGASVRHKIEIVSPEPDSTRVAPAENNFRVKTSPLICFEDSFPEVARAAANDDIDFLVNVTNDGWFGEGAEQWQHAANAIFRAVENGLPLVRCANNGLTCWIDDSGRVQQFLKDDRGDIHRVGALTVEIPLPAPGEKRAPTFYHRHGDWFGWACVVVTGIVFIFRKRI
jgi:apolipoprotein N-acyltransferase